MRSGDVGASLAAPSRRGLHGFSITAILSSSRNAVSFSSALTMNLFPSLRRASAVKRTRPVELICDEQPQVQPDALSLSAIVSQYFTLIKRSNACYAVTRAILLDRPSPPSANRNQACQVGLPSAPGTLMYPQRSASSAKGTGLPLMIVP